MRSGSHRRSEGSGKPWLFADGTDVQCGDDVRRRLRRDALASAPPASAIGSVDMVDIHKVGQGTQSMTMIQALRSAMDVMLERDDDVVIFGQDVGYFGGVFRCTEG